MSLHHYRNFRIFIEIKNGVLRFESSMNNSSNLHIVYQIMEVGL